MRVIESQKKGSSAKLVSGNGARWVLIMSFSFASAYVFISEGSERASISQESLTYRTGKVSDVQYGSRKALTIRLEGSDAEISFVGNYPARYLGSDIEEKVLGNTVVVGVIKGSQEQLFLRGPIRHAATLSMGENVILSFEDYNNYQKRNGIILSILGFTALAFGILILCFGVLHVWVRNERRGLKPLGAPPA